MGEANEKLMLAVDNMLGAYGKKYRLARGGIRENAPCRKEVAELWVVYNDIQTAHINPTPAPREEPAPEIAALRAEIERLRKAITEVRAEFYTDYVGKKLTGVSYGSTALARVVGLLDAAVAPEQEEAGS